MSNYDPMIFLPMNNPDSGEREYINLKYIEIIEASKWGGYNGSRVRTISGMHKYTTETPDEIVQQLNELFEKLGIL